MNAGRLKRNAMSRRRGASFAIPRRARAVRRLAPLLLPLAAALLPLRAGPGSAQESLLGATAMAAASVLGAGTASGPSSGSCGFAGSSHSTFDGGGMSGLSGMPAGSGVSTSGIAGVPVACASSLAATPSANDASAGGASAPGAMQPASHFGSASAASSAVTVPSAPCIGADSPAGIAAAMSGTGSTGRAGGSIAGMGGGGEIIDAATVASGTGISGATTACADGPLAAIHLDPTTSTTSPTPMSSDESVSLFGME